MSSKLSNDTVGKKLVDFYNPILDEVRDTFKNNSYEEIQRAYNLSDKEINGYVEKYLSKIKNTDLAIAIAITLIPTSGIEISIEKLAVPIFRFLEKKGVEISAKKVIAYIMKLGKTAFITKATKEKMIGKSDYMKLSSSKVKDLNQELNDAHKEGLLVAVAARELERSQVAGKLADKDEDFLRPITTKNLSSVSPKDIRNMCEGDNICIDEDRFRKKYPNGDIKIARERLGRYLNFRDNYINPNQIARTNYYLKPFTKIERPYSNKQNTPQNNGRSR